MLDPMLGIDIHWELIPPAMVPTPLPNPFVGIVFDPMGLAAGLAIGGMMGAVTGAPFKGPVVYWGAFRPPTRAPRASMSSAHPDSAGREMGTGAEDTQAHHPSRRGDPRLPSGRADNDAVIITGSKTVAVMRQQCRGLAIWRLSCSAGALPLNVGLAVPKGAPS